MTKTNDLAIQALRGKSSGNRNARCLVFGMLVVSLLISSYIRAEQSNKGKSSLSSTPSQYKPYAIALGQRLQKPGKERIIANGSLAYNADGPEKALSVEVIWQYPLKVRLTQNGSALAFDRSNPMQKIPESQRMAELVQVLLEDTVEGFWSIRSTFGSARYIGSGFRLPNTAPGDSGMDIIQAKYADVFRGGKPIVKTYRFNSRTKLLGMVGYTLASGAHVDVIIDDWRDIRGERVPFLIERWENGKRNMQLALSSATVTAGSEDGIFGGN